MAGKGLPGPLRPHLLLLSVTAISFFVGLASSSETDTLLEFKSTLSTGATLSTWVAGPTQPCGNSGNHSNWGPTVICYGGRVWGLKLEGMGLSGTLNLDPLVKLPGLRTLSFMRNNLVGPIPDIARLGALKSLYLSGNHFEGEIPDDVFSGMRSLKKVHLARNEFTGRIPSSVSRLQRLMELRLDHNHFTGVIPELINERQLRSFDVSYNDLEGKVPDRLNKMNATSFQGNENLCGPPLDVECEILSPTSLPRPKRKTSPLLIALISLLVLLLVLVVIFVITRRSKSDQGEQEYDNNATAPRSTTKEADVAEVDKLEQGTATVVAAKQSSGSAKKGTSKEAADHNKLSFVRAESKGSFELQDLLRASAEVLGSGNFGSSYKAVLLTGPSVVVKRFKEMNGVGKEDFMEHMRRLGRLSHPNLLSLVAYYYRKEEKLLITTYKPNGSLAHMLHGRGPTVPPLEWPARLRIVKGVARGLAYLYEELPVLNLPHGHLKSSNVLLDDNYEPLLADYALVPVMNQNTASQVMVSYKSPEVTQIGRVSKKSDVWSLGILTLEILTGKFPATYLQKGKGGMDLVGWVSSVVQDELSVEVFDKEMEVSQNIQGEMFKLLKIGLECCEVDVNKRREMKDVLEKIEEVKEMDNKYSTVDDVSFAK